MGQLALKVLSSPLFYVTAGFAGAARLVGVSGDSRCVRRASSPPQGCWRLGRVCPVARLQLLA